MGVYRVIWECTVAHVGAVWCIWGRAVRAWEWIWGGYDGAVWCIWGRAVWAWEWICGWYTVVHMGMVQWYIWGTDDSGGTGHEAEWRTAVHGGIAVSGGSGMRCMRGQDRAVWSIVNVGQCCHRLCGVGWH